jgi:hypothetical protein
MYTFKQAVIDQLVVAHIYRKEHDTDPRKALNDLLSWHVQLALDPSVSSDAQALIDMGVAIAANHKVSSDGAAAVATNYFWQSMESCPIGVKVQLLGKGGVATYGVLTRHVDGFWKGWAPVPKERK